MKRIALIAACALALAVAVGGIHAMSRRRAAPPVTTPAEETWPLAWEDLIARYAAEYGLEPARVAAVICCESGFHADAESAVGARGLMQIMPDTGRWIAERLGDADFTVDDLFDPATSIRYGCWYLHYLEGRFGADATKVTAAYHAGEGTVAGWLADPAYSADGKTLASIPESNPQTRNYITKVALATSAYRAIYKEKMDS